MSPAWLRGLGSPGKTAAEVILELLAGTSCNMGTTWVVTSTPTVHSDFVCPCNRTLHKALPPMHTQLCAAAQLQPSVLPAVATPTGHLLCTHPPPCCSTCNAGLPHIHSARLCTPSLSHTRLLLSTAPPTALSSPCSYPLQTPGPTTTSTSCSRPCTGLYHPPAPHQGGASLHASTHTLHHSSSSSSSSSSSASSSHLMKGSMSLRNTLRPLGWLPFLYLRARRDGVECGDDRVTKVHSCYSNQDMSHGARATVQIHTEAWQGPFNHTRLHNP